MSARFDTARRRAPRTFARSSGESLFHLAAALGLSFSLAAHNSAQAGDILRGGATSGSRPGRGAAANPNAVTAEVAQANGRDALARTTQAITALQAMQKAARDVAARNSGLRALPPVPNGLAVGGLQVAPGVPKNLHKPGPGEDPKLWTGALLPKQTQSAGETRVTIKQNKSQALLTWQTFNIGSDTTLTFDQSAGGANKGDWIAFNTVLDPSGAPSQILGAIEAPGQVYVISQNGIVFGGSSQVNLRTLVASTLPLNKGLISRGVLNNPDGQFLFSALAQPAGENGTPAFTPIESLRDDHRQGDVVVEKGAQISSPVSADGNGGRVLLVGANVTNEGTISTPAGQTILAAGLQVGIDGHRSSDPTLRGLDVYVGKVRKPAPEPNPENPDAPVLPAEPAYAGRVTNRGIIEVPRGDLTLAGKAVRQLGAVDSSTSVSLNGRVDLTANYGAIPNPKYTPGSTDPTLGAPFLFTAAGSVTLGADSVLQILPELSSGETAIGLELALASQINLQGHTIHLASDALVLAPNADATLRAGQWHVGGTAEKPITKFLAAGGQVYLDSGTLIDVAGSTGASAALAQNILSLELRGAELAPSPLQRDGVVRGLTLSVDLRNRGLYGDREWIGTPLGDVRGLAGLIERSVGELTAAGGSVDISAGDSVVLREGSAIDVSGGWVRYEGGNVRTTRLLSGGQILDIAEATPDRIYDGVFTGTATFTNPRYGLSETFAHPLAPTGEHFEAGYRHGMDAGAITIAAPAMALDGELRGQTAPGPRQVRTADTASMLPQAAALTLSFHAERDFKGNTIATFPTSPQIVFRNSGVPEMTPADFAVDVAGEPAELTRRRRANVVLSSDLFAESGFGSLTVNNEGGDVFVPAGVTVNAGAGGNLSLTAGNVEIGGAVLAPGGSLAFKSFNITPFEAALSAGQTDPVLPTAQLGRGGFTLSSGATLSTAGLLVDERNGARTNPRFPITLRGGEITITAFSADLAAGSTLDVSGGVLARATGGFSYGDAGGITVRTGQDAGLLSLLGGGLNLDATLRGFSGAKGGALSVQAPRIQVGGSTAPASTLQVAPEFFRTGGFSSFALTGLGVAASADGQNVPEVFIAPGTKIEPVATSAIANGRAGLSLRPLEKPVDLRTPVSLTFAAPGVIDSFTGGLVSRGDLVFGEGASVRTDPRASVALTATTTTMLGSIFAPAGTITISAAKSSSVFGGTPNHALATAYVGPQAVLSTAGAAVFSADRFARNTGTVLPGGTISISGNLVAAAGALLDVSGASATLDFAPASAAPLAAFTISGASGLTQPLAAAQSVALQMDSAAGAITLTGGQMLLIDATLLGRAGGPTALGGTLTISSGRFDAPGETPRPFHRTLTVTQNGQNVPASVATGGAVIGTAVGPAGRGYFAADAFAHGGFDALKLGGVVDFRGSVEIVGRGALSVADGGVLYANSTVHLAAPYVALGLALPAPLRPEEQRTPFLDGSAPLNFAPTFGRGELRVDADLIDLGTLSLQGIGRATLAAENGDIRGSGIVNLAGDLTLRAAQIYPVTAGDLTIVAYDHRHLGNDVRGSITIASVGTAQFPFSAAGALSLYASTISQGGTLRAPLGTINLGWDGTGGAPVDLLAGATLPFPITRQLTMRSGSTTSVSAIDPATGKGVLIPFGVSPDGSSLVDPRGVDITAGGLREKSIALSGAHLAMEAGSLVDLRGGGDLYAYRFVEGNGGATDVLATDGAFAVLPDYRSNFSPFAPFNVSASDANLIGEFGPGYVNTALHAGDRIYLNKSASLAAGSYTLLPARYALLPGAVLVTPKSGTPFGTFETPEGASLVSGYRFNALAAERPASTFATLFEVATPEVFRARAEYEDYTANTFLGAASVGSARLPEDSGNLLFRATQSMQLFGQVASPSISGGRGSTIDISTPRDLVINASGESGAARTIALSAPVLSGFGAESLLIGGERVRGENGTTVNVQSGSIMIDNAGAPLSAPDLILAAKTSLTLERGAQIAASGTLSAAAETLFLEGDGTLLRVGQDAAARTVRTVVPTEPPTLTIGAGAAISGASVILDSTGNTLLDRRALLNAEALTLNSGRISLVLENPGALEADPGLLLNGTTFANLQSANTLSLLSYSTLDFYGTGTLGSGSGALKFGAGEIRGFNQDGGTMRIAAGSITLANPAKVLAGPAGTLGDGALEFAADTIVLGANNLAIRGFAEVALEASERVLGVGKGGLATQGALTLETPLLTGAASARREITAAGALTIRKPADASGALRPGGLGSTLQLTGASVDVNSAILLPSGALSIHATSGALEIGGRLSVAGTRQDFYDVARFTDAGEIRLVADAGDVTLAPGSVINVGAKSGGGDAGTLAISVPNGAFTLDGALHGAGGRGGADGAFVLDALALPSTAALSTALTNATLIGSQIIRVRTGDATIDGVARAHEFSLSADAGTITVTGEVNASGATGGAISLIANQSVRLVDGARLSVAGADFSSAGKGGAISLEAGAERDGIVGIGEVDLGAGATIDLSVAAQIAGDALTAGSSASLGQFSGTLHLRAPQIAGFTDVAVNPIASTIIDPSSILVEGYRIYDLTATGGQISSAVQTSIRADGQAWLGTAAAPSANYTAVFDRLLADTPENAALRSTLVLTAGAEVINRAGDLTLGSANSTTTSDWNLATFRYGAKAAPGVLTLRAAGNLVFFNALSDGFTPTLANTNPSWLQLARLSAQNAALPINTQSWSFRLSAGADLGAANFSTTLAPAALGENAGFLKLGKDNTLTGNNTSDANGSHNSPGNSALTQLALANRFQVIRTGSGDIDIYAGRSVQLLNHFASIYTAGTRVTNPTLDGAFDLPVLNQSGAEGSLGANQQPAPYPALYSMAGGNVTIAAAENIEHLTMRGGELVADSVRELPNNWLYRRGYVDPASGEFVPGRFNDVSSTSWWVDFSNFFEGVGALGGGDVTLTAGRDIANVDAVIPTNARLSKDGRDFLELGGGDLEVHAGRNIDAGVYYVERGQGTLTAGHAITTNATRSPSLTTLVAENPVEDERTWLPTTLFIGKGGFDVSARGDVLLGPVGNPFLLPAGINNTYWHRSYFSTYAPGTYVDLESLGGAVTLREAASFGGVLTPLLQAWAERQQLLTDLSASSYQPWLRLAENSTLSFGTALSLLPGTLHATAYSGDINLAGDLTLSPAAKGTLELLARGAINGLQPVGLGTASAPDAVVWHAAEINVSDANPRALPGVANPLGYPTAGVGAFEPTRADFFADVDALFLESGGTLGEQAVLQTKLALHAPGPLHLRDAEPTRLYAGGGDIAGLTLFSPKAAQVFAGRDIADVALYLQNTSAGQTSIVSAKRDLIPYNANAALRVAANAAGNLPLDPLPLAGDLQISGPGTLEVLAGRDLDLGTGANNDDGTGVGITSIGNARNPYLPFTGANLVIAAGLETDGGLSRSKLDFATFLKSDEARAALAEIAAETPGGALATETEEERNRAALAVFYRVLRNAGRGFAESGNYESGFAAIDTLFHANGETSGEVRTRGRDVRTRNGGDIFILAPGGGLTLANTAIGEPLTPPGIVTEGGGAISIFAQDDVEIGIGRIFTLRGGDQVIWSSAGDIAAGAAAKTVQSAPPTRVLLDPQTASVQTDLAGLATGGGIGVLATVANVPAGSVDLIAPAGTVDAGDAGVRASGNITVAAQTVLNADNFSATGASTGVPTSTPSVAAPNLGGLTAASSAAGAANNTAQSAANQAQRTPSSTAEEMPSIVTVEVLGYGGGDTGNDDDEKRKRREEEAQAEQ